MDREKILQIVGNKPRSTSGILKEVNNLDLHPFIKSFLSLLKEGKIEMIGFYPCEFTGREMPYYLSYHNPTIPNSLTPPQYVQRYKS